MMNKNESLKALTALSQEPRLDVFRLLVQAGETGLAAGEISEKLEQVQNTTSSHLSLLMNAGLIKRTREGRSLRYYAEMGGMRGLIEFLLEDCCGGNAGACKSFFETIDCCD